MPASRGQHRSDLETRVGQAYGARTIGELAVALRDLPAASTRRIGAPARLRTPSRRHLSGFSLCAILNIALLASAIDGFMEEPHQIGSYVDQIAALGFSATCVWGAILGFRALAPRRSAARRHPRSVTS